MAPVITLTTDFGVGDGYAASMKNIRWYNEWSGTSCPRTQARKYR